MNSIVALPLSAVAVPAPPDVPPAPAEMPAATSPDADLLEQERVFFVYVADYEKAMEKTEEASDRFDELIPEQPDALRVDFKRDFWHFGGLAGRWRTAIDSNDGYWPSLAIEEHIRNIRCETTFTVTKNMDGTDLDRDLTDADVSGVTFLEVQERVPDLKAQTRADEIVAAHDRHRAEVNKLRDSTGLQPAEVMETWLRAGLQEMSCRLMKTPAKTLAGFQAKARVAAWWHEGEIDIDSYHGHDEQCVAWIVRELGQVAVA